MTETKTILTYIDVAVVEKMTSKNCDEIQRL